MMNTIKNIAKTAERAINEPTDYLNEVDNLMYCGKCHTPKHMTRGRFVCHMTRGRFVCHARYFTARSTIILPSPNTRLN